MPVEAPEGTLATPTVPSERKTVDSTVGFPLESNISLAQQRMICGLFIVVFSFQKNLFW
jgi:hypothetical protein